MMDWGRFGRSRRLLAAWLAAPAAAALAVHLGGHALAGRLSADAQRVRLLTELIPDLEARVRTADQTLLSFSLAPGGSAAATEEVTACISRAADPVGFVLNTLRVEEQAEGPRRIIRVVFSGEGDLYAVMRFANEVRRSEGLYTLDVARLTLIQSRDGSRYAGEFMLTFHTDCLLKTTGEGPREAPE